MTRFSRAHRQDMQDYPFHNQAAMFLEPAWVDLKK
jgi:hypothetical protein